jgi:hypothetical protein
MSDDSNHSSRTRLSILMTEGSSLSARQALYALGPRHTIDLIDPSPLCQCRFSRFVRRWDRCPSFAKDPCSFLTFLGELLRKRRYDVLLSTHEEVFLLARVRDALSRHVGLALPDFSALARLHSKLQFLELLQELQLPHPEACVVSDRSQLESWTDFPQFVKLDIGTAGSGVRLVRDRGELTGAVQAFEDSGLWRDGTPLLLQRPASGRPAVVRAVFRHGELVGVHANESLQQGVGGAAVARVSCSHPRVVDHVRRLGGHLKWHGPLFLDYFYDESTQSPSYIEADPRIGDTANATFSGSDVCQRWVDVALNRPIEPWQPYARDVRSHAGFLVLMSRALTGAKRRDLWSEAWQQWRGHGIYEHSDEEMTLPGSDLWSIVPYAWVVGRLLARPSVANEIVQKTVANYSLSTEAAERIRAIPLEQLNDCLDRAAHGNSPKRDAPTHA